MVLRIIVCKTIIIFTEVITIAAQKGTRSQYRTNRNITAEEVRLIGTDGTAIGIMSVNEALKHSEAAGLDLVEISPNARPPVCRIMDYGKFMFGSPKGKRKQKRNRKPWN